jgi:hypothetical protein
MIERAENHGAQRRTHNLLLIKTHGRRRVENHDTLIRTQRMCHLDRLWREMDEEMDEKGGRGHENEGLPNRQHVEI